VVSAAAANHRWSVAELELLKVVWHDAHPLELPKLFPSRTHSALWNRAYRMGLRRRRWGNYLRLGTMPLPASASRLSRDKAYILGVLIGDGSLFHRELSLTTIDLDFAQSFRNCVSRCYGVKARIFTETRERYRQGYAYRVRIKRLKVAEDLRRYFPDGGCETFTWSIPPDVQTASNTIKGAFLGGYFDSEGSPSRSQLTASSVNLPGLRQIMTLLGGLGIKSTAYHHDDKRRASGTGRLFILDISRTTDLRGFKKLVGFTIKRKRDALRRLCSRAPRLYGPDVIKEVREHYKISGSSLKTAKAFGLNGRMIRSWVHDLVGVFSNYRNRLDIKPAGA